MTRVPFPRLGRVRTNRFSHTGPKKGAPKTPSKAEVDACTHITLRQHSRAEYDKFTPAEKAKHYQLKKDSGWYDKDKKRTVAEVSTGDDGGETATGTNSTNPALFHQGKIPKSEK